VESQQAAVPTAKVNDPQRLQALYDGGLLDAGTVAALDRLTGMVRRLLQVPVVLVSLVDADRQVFAGACGLAGDPGEIRQTPLSHSHCRYVIEGDAPFIVTDARTDPRLAGHPVITEYEAIAYAGFPLRTAEGLALGDGKTSRARTE